MRWPSVVGQRRSILIILSSILRSRLVEALCGRLVKATSLGFRLCGRSTRFLFLERRFVSRSQILIRLCWCCWRFGLESEAKLGIFCLLFMGRWQAIVVLVVLRLSLLLGINSRLS